MLSKNQTIILSVLFSSVIVDRAHIRFLNRLCLEHNYKKVLYKPWSQLKGRANTLQELSPLMANLITKLLPQYSNKYSYWNFYGCSVIFAANLLGTYFDKA